MKRSFYFLIIGLLFIAFACSKKEQNYSFSRATFDQNFKTIYDGELYAYTVDDKAISRADYYLLVEGDISSYGDTIVRYGHCWSSTVTEPTVETADSFTIFPVSGLANIANITGFKFESPITNLVAGTDYYVRTWVERRDGTIGYNPTTTLVPTKPAIDEWFEQLTTDKPSSSWRTDALVFNFGDTIFFGTGQTGNGQALLNDVITYLPSQSGSGTWSTDFIKPLPDGTNGGLPGKLMNGIGFAMEYKIETSPRTTKSIFIGFGDHVGNDLVSDKSVRLLEYDLSKSSWTATEPFGIARSNAVCFVINGFAYIGTGKSTHVLSDWIIYDPVEAAKDKPNNGWRQLQTIPGGAKARQGAVAFTLNGVGYFGLGVTEDGTFLDDFWAFTPDRDDPASGTWQQRAFFKGGPRANAVAFVIGEQAYVGTGDNIIGDMYEGPYTGQIFNDFYRYDPYTNTWLDVQPYTADKTGRDGAVRAITRAIGFAIPSKKEGYVGYGTQPFDYVAPNPPESQSGIPTQQDFWKYQPFNDSAKK